MGSSFTGHTVTFSSIVFCIDPLIAFENDERSENYYPRFSFNLTHNTLYRDPDFLYMLIQMTTRLVQEEFRLYGLTIAIQVLQPSIGIHVSIIDVLKSMMSKIPSIIEVQGMKVAQESFNAFEMFSTVFG